MQITHGLMNYVFEEKRIKTEGILNHFNDTAEKEEIQIHKFTH